MSLQLKAPALLTAALGFAASIAIAQDDDFSLFDADGSGGLSVSEAKAIAPNVTDGDFAAYDADGSGELSREEFDAWMKMSSKSE